MDYITLADALASDRLGEFVAQAEAEGIGPADRAQFEGLVGTLTAPQREDQTSRSPAPGSKPGK